ncbi:glycosyl transferase [Gammaproteobacteria bacterium]|nr:glycosyl transferase [Gammaproteobacteria bacterium]
MRRLPFFLLLLIGAIHAAIWSTWELSKAHNPWFGTINGVSFSPYRANQSPEKNKHPSITEIDEDLSLVAAIGVRNIRIYSTTEGLEKSIMEAKKYGLNVTLGAWIGKDKVKNDQEIAALIELANTETNVVRVLVGNESLHRGDVTLDELAQYIKEVKDKIKQPVSTAEARYIWINKPQLAQHVDFLTVHLLPYWERTTIEDAIPFVLEQYDILEKTYPDKPILVGEVGWPSNGNKFGGAVASLNNQASFLKDWLSEARKRNIDYFIIEAFDQPWKKKIEGTVGPYWGLFDANRKAKFQLSSAHADNNPTWIKQTALSTLIGMLLMLLFARGFRNLEIKGYVFYFLVIQGAVTLLIRSYFLPQQAYIGVGGLSILMIMLLAQLALITVVLINAFEFTELLWRKEWKRTFKPLIVSKNRDFPKVSIHVACYSEPPDLVMNTLNHLALLDYPNFEVLVIDNNTPNPEDWRPLQAYCKKLGARFRFFHIEPWAGFKAGALNFGVDQTAADAQMIAVIDADYVVESNWLNSLIPYFDNPKVGFVQAPQDHRDWQGDAFKTMLNWEYAGFFNIGMIHRNERNAIIQHGTMTIIRKHVLVESGGWGEWSICEDTELGMRMMKLGYESVYVNHSFGHGVVPDSFVAYKTQRFRWAYGAVQILRRYWRDLLPFNKSGLTSAQKFHFITGWLPWFADSLHLVFSLLAIMWSMGLVFLPEYFEFPMPVFLFSVLILFLLKIAHGLILYKSLVRCNFKQRIGAAIAGIALTHVVGRAMLAGLFSPGKPFLRTPKGENKPALMRGFLMAREESLMWLTMWGYAALIFNNYYVQSFTYGNVNGDIVRYAPDSADALYWAILLVVQSLPYLAALLLSLINVWPSKRSSLK